MICRSIVAAIAVMFATTAAMATDLESFYFRYDFSDGAKQFIGSASQASDPITADAGTANFDAACGQDGAATAVHVKSNAYGTDKIGGSSAAGKAVLAGDWTLAMSVRPGSVEKGLLFSLGRANDNNSKCVFLASSSTAGKIYVGTARKKGSANSYTGSVDRELAQEWGLTGASADTTSGYHSIVAVHSSGGMVAGYVDGELAGSVDTTENASGCVFGNGIQFNQAHGSSTFLSANGYSQSLNNPDVAFQDVRFYNFAFTAEAAAAYAALYPATLPGFSNLDQYAYVQSYGVNGVDTGVYMTDTDKFTADFAFTDVSYKSWLCGAGKNANKQTHAIYLNGNQQLAWTTRGEWWWSTWPSAKIEGSTIEDTRLVMTVESSLKANLTYYDTRATKSSDASAKTATSTGPSLITTHLFRGNGGIMDNNTQACKAKIYSFEVVTNSSSITPRAFFAPTADGNGDAGFMDVVAGTFHGECQSNPSTALTFTSGVGRAEDYRYRSGKFYSRIYASSADSETGLVKFDGGEAAGTNAQFTARGKTAKIIAVPAEGYTLDRWEGDTWAITTGSAITTNITVKSDTAIQLRATFMAKSEADALLTVAADGAGSINWSEADWRDIENPEVQIPYPTDKNVTIVAYKSFTLTLDAAVALNNLTVRADTNCVVTLVKGVGSLVTVETIAESGVLKQGSASALGNTPKVTVEDGGTFDVNGLAPSRNTTFCIAGAGAGNWPWALTSSVNVTDDKNSIDIVNLADDATIGGNVQMCIGVRVGATFNPTTETLPLTLNGHTLTKTGAGTLWFRRPYSTNEGTIDVQSGSMKITDWGNANVAYGESCVSNIALVAREGTTVVNEMKYGSPSYPIYFKSLDLRGATMTSSYGAFGLSAGETLSGHGTAAKLTMADGAVATLDGNLSVTTTLTADGALSFVRKAGVETNVTVSVSGTFATTEGKTITVGEGVVLDLGTSRPAATLAVDAAVALALRLATNDETPVLKVSANPASLVVHRSDGVTDIASSCTIEYDAEAGTITITPPVPVWTNADGTGSFENVENWDTGEIPADGSSISVSNATDVTIAVASAHAYEYVSVKGGATLSFTGNGSLAAGALAFFDGTELKTGGVVVPAAFNGTGDLVLETGNGAEYSVTGASALTGKLTIKATASFTNTLSAAVNVTNMTVDADANVVVTLVKGSGGSFYANEVVVAGGVLQQGSASVLGSTPKLTVMDRSTFDINKLKIENATKSYIAGTGAGDWPWAICSRSGSMVDGNYLANITLNADATIGGPGQLKIGVSDSAGNEIVLNGHKLTLSGNWATFRNLNTAAGTLELASGYTITLNKWHNLNSNSGTYSGTTLIVCNGAKVVNQTDRTIKATNIQLDGGSITASDTQTFSPISVLSGHGTIARLAMPTGAVYRPDGADYLNVNSSLSGTLKVDISDPSVAGKANIPLLKVPTSLRDTAEAAFDLTALPSGWELRNKETDGNIEYWLKHRGFTIILR